MTSLQGSASAPLTDAPGPAPMPLLGAAGTVIRYATDPIGFAGRIFREYGDVAMLVRAPIRVMSPNGHGVVLVNGAKHNREILTQHDRYHMYALPGRFYPEGEASPREVPVRRTMTGLFHVNDDEHRRHRRLLMPAFQKTRIDGYRDDMAALSTELVDRWRDGEVRDVHADMTELTLRIATKTLFGEDAGEDGLRLAQRMQAWLVTMFGIGMMIARDWPLLPYRRWLDLTAALDRETVAILRRKRDKGATGTDMLSALIAARDDDGTGLTEDELVGHTGVVFAAGHETSTNALAWTLLLLSQHPDVARDLADELTGALHGEAPTVDDLAKLPLLDGVVKESMRVLPPVPLHPRLVAKDSELGGYKLPKNTEIFLSIYHMHMDPDVFADPRAFSPRRWERIKPSTFEYNPFSAGPRMCIGAAFATMEIKIALATILQRFSVETPEGSRVSPRVAITMAPAGGLRMRVVRGPGAARRAVQVRGRIRDLVRLPS